MAAARRRAKAEVEQSRQKEREMLLSAFEQVQFLFGFVNTTLDITEESESLIEWVTKKILIF